MPKIILTFDDAPSKNFEKLLNYLIKNEHKAIFFVVGKKVNKNNEKSLIRAIKKGFLIGNHSYSQPNFSKISLEESENEIEKTDKIIEKLYKKARIKRPIKIFRFPFFNQGGVKKAKLQNYLKYRNFENPYYKSYSLLAKFYRGKYDLFCTLDPKDWSKETTLEKAISKIKNPRNGDIIDLHDHLYSFNRLIRPICGYLKNKEFILSY